MKKNQKENIEYSQNANALHGLSERDKVRTKMGMYAGGTGVEALHVLIREPNDNSIDEWNYLKSIGKPFDKIKISIDSKNTICSVRDYGRGIPYVKDENGVSVLEKAVSVLHMGGKHDNNSNHLTKEKIDISTDNYQFSSGINGVGITLTNYASDLFYGIVFNEKKKEKAYVSYEDGYKKEFKLVKLDEKIEIFDDKIKSNVLNNDILNNDLKTGTLIVFKPSIKEDAFDDHGVFDEDVKFNKEMVIKQLKTLPYLNPGLEIELNFDGEIILFEKKKHFKDIIDDEAKNKPLIDTVYFKERMVYAQNKENKTAKVYSLEDFIKLPYSQRKNYKVIETVFELAFNFQEGSEVPFQENNVNGSIIIQGGKQDTALKSKMQHYINEYIAENFKSIGKFEKEDIMNSMSFMFQVKINEPKFAGQTKNKLDNSELTQFSNFFFKKYLKHWINREDKTKMTKLIKVLEANRKARLASTKIKEDVFKEVLNKSDDALLSNSTKLTKQKSKDPKMCELFLAEGDSAKGPIKDSRVVEYQAVLPLKGKLINALKAKQIGSLLNNEEIINLVTALGCGIGKEYDYSKLKYHKIIIISDKDIDGLHIRNLNLVFLYKFYPDLIKKGHVYIVDAPLYVIKTSKKEYYAWSVEERDEISSKLETKYTITRYKGLGEMNPEQLYDTCLNKKNRRLYQITLSEYEDFNEEVLKPMELEKEEYEETINEISEDDITYQYQELINIYMNDRKQDTEARTKLVAEYYSTPKETIITLEEPLN
jgi:DNA gyrase subunit B